jgi:hypothetical protein
MMDTAKAAVTGNALAVARMQAFAKLMGSTPEFGFHYIPDPEDFEAARKGDAAAIERLRRLGEARAEAEGTGSGSGSHAGLQGESFLSFHPPLGKRAKRLQKMGSRLMAPTRQYGFGLKIFMFVLYLIVGPVLVAAGVMMLFAVGLMIAMNLMFLGLWLTVVHWAFGQDWVANYNGFMRFVDDVERAFSSAQHRR